MPAEEAARAAEAAARRSYGGLVAFLAARKRDVAGAEDALAEAFGIASAFLVAQCGRKEEAAQAYQRAIGLARDDAVRRFLQRRAQGEGR